MVDRPDWCIGKTIPKEGAETFLIGMSCTAEKIFTFHCAVYNNVVSGKFYRWKFIHSLSYLMMAHNTNCSDSGSRFLVVRHNHQTTV